MDSLGFRRARRSHLVFASTRCVHVCGETHTVHSCNVHAHFPTWSVGVDVTRDSGRAGVWSGLGILAGRASGNVNSVGCYDACSDSPVGRIFSKVRYACSTQNTV